MGRVDSGANDAGRVFVAGLGSSAVGAFDVVNGRVLGTIVYVDLNCLVGSRVGLGSVFL